MIGWESLQEITDRSKEESQAREIANAYFNCFNTEAGRWVLEDLVNKFLTKPIVRPGESSEANGVREGRADIVRQILLQVEYAKNPESSESGVFTHLKKLLRK